MEINTENILQSITFVEASLAYIRDFVSSFLLSFISYHIRLFVHNGKKTTINQKSNKPRNIVVLCSSFLIAIIIASINYYADIDFPMLVIISVIAGLCGSEILTYLTEPGCIRLLLSGILRNCKGGIIKIVCNGLARMLKISESDMDQKGIEESVNKLGDIVIDSMGNIELDIKKDERDLNDFKTKE